MVCSQLALAQSWYITAEEAFDFKSAEYKALFDASDATVFQAPYWLATFYEKLLQPLSLTPLIVTVRDELGALLMVLPCIRQMSSGIKVVQPADLGVADYNCPVAYPHVLEQISEDAELQTQILAALEPYDVFFFRKQRSDKPLIEDIIGGASVSPADAGSHQVPLTAPYQEWALEKLSSNFRSGNRRKMKKLLADHSTCEFETLTETAKIEEALRFIQHHRGQRYDDDVLSQDIFFNFYLDIATKYAADGFAQTFVMSVDGEMVAAFFGLNLNGCHCYLLGSFMTGKYDRYSVGMQSLTALIENRIEHGCTLFDFALGDEGYKDRFGADKIDIHHAVYARSVVGKLISYTYENAKPLKNFLKQFNPKLR